MSGNIDPACTNAGGTQRRARVLRRWWRNEREHPVHAQPAESNDAVSPTLIVAEYSAYGRRIAQQLFLGFFIGAAAVATFHGLTWFLGSIGTSSDHPVLAISLAPAELIVAGFGILAAIVVALQVAVRSPVDSQGQELAAVVARRQFLGEVSTLMVAAAFVLGAYATAPAILNLGSKFDFARLLGPSVAAVGVALIAADAGSATDRASGAKEIANAWRERERARLEHGIAVFGVREFSTLRERGWRWVALSLPPVVSSLAAWQLFLAPLGIDVWVPVLVACSSAGIIYCLSIVICELAIMRSWFMFTMTMVLIVIYALVALVVFLTLLLSFPTRSVLTGSAVAISFVLIPMVVAGFSLRSASGILAHAVARRLRNRRERLRRGTRAFSAVPHNRLAVAAAVVFWLPPAALALALVAKRQIDLANAVKPNSQRGVGLLRFAIWASLILNAAVVFGLFAIGSFI